MGDNNVLKKSDLSYKQGEDSGISHLYRMVLKPDNTVRVEIDEEKIYEGSIKEDWEVLKPKEIPDPEDKKPSDWVDSSMMDDPEDKKPDDWVEESEKRIVDAEAKKPADWDDEEDGEWEAPMKDNPAYKGEWTVKRIENPAYKGFWQVKGGTIFDNVIVCDDKADADAFIAKWKALSEHEKAEKKKEEDTKKEEESKKDDDDDDDDAEDKKEEAEEA